MTVPLTSSPGASTGATAAPSDVTSSALRHMMVVGGTLADWARLGDDRWSRRVDELGLELSRCGAAWLTLRAYEPGDALVELPAWTRLVGSCEVVVDPCADGRRRFAEAMSELDPTEEVNEATVAAALYEPADCEPDLVLVLGPDDQLPPSLVWELAYAELVFIPIAWHELDVEHVRDAVDDFSGRRRRFGGLES